MPRGCDNSKTCSCLQSWFMFTFILILDIEIQFMILLRLYKFLAQYKFTKLHASLICVSLSLAQELYNVCHNDSYMYTFMPE